MTTHAKQRLLANGWLTPQSAADRCASSLSTVYRLVREGRLDFVRLGSRLYVRASSVDAYLGTEAAAALADADTTEEPPCV